MSPIQLLYRLGVDVVLWYCVPSAFLFVYVFRYSISADAVIPHLRLVFLPLLGLLLIRMAWNWSSSGYPRAYVALSMIASALLATMLLYYGLVLIGLQSWGRVISWDLIVSYASQAFELADAIGISLPLVLGVAGLVYFGLFAATWVYIRYFDWVPFLLKRSSGWIIGFAMLSVSAIIAIELYSFLSAPWTRESEPVSLTFFPHEAAWNFQGHTIDRLSAAKIDRAEDAVRAVYRPNSGANRRNVILIVVDALRPDHMGLYGYGRDTTPNLNRLAKAGTLRKANPVHATCASSACGLLSIASSKFVDQFSNRPFTLQEVLKRHGYRIHMLLSGDHSNFYDLKRIYGEVDSYFDIRPSRGFGYMNDDRLVLDRLAVFPAWDGVPVMMQFHLMSSHLLGKRHADSIKYLPSTSYILPENRIPGSAAGVNTRGINYYDNGVLQADTIIQQILQNLERKGYLQDTVVAITADHGESLGEHGLFQHSNSVREEVLRIPFALLSYGYRPTHSIDNKVGASQVDIAPTILVELGMPRPESWAGEPLQEPISREFTYFQERFDVGLLDRRDPGNLWKYWVNSRNGVQFAFNLSVDPQENLNAISNVPLSLRRQWRTRVLSGVAVGIAPRGDVSDFIK